MNFLNKYKNTVTAVTVVILTNMITAFLIVSGLVSFDDTVVLKNPSAEFRQELVKLNGLNTLINDNYIGTVDNAAMGEAMAQTMFEQIGDPYSVYFSKDDYTAISDMYTATFGGIGVVIDGSEPGRLLITKVLDNTPAQKAGVQENDVITAVNGEDVRGADVTSVVAKTRGEAGTDVTVTVERGGVPMDFSMTREKINDITVQSLNLDGTGYIYISEFGAGTADEFKKALDELLAEGVTGLVIDLRDNGGGVVSAATEVADMLMDSGEVGYAVDKNGNRQDFTTKDGKVEIPFVVLVNGNTASASELLAGALKQTGTPIVGTRTYGKGVIQGMSGLGDGSGFKLTLQEYFLKDGSAVNKVGIEPTVVIDASEAMKNGEITSVEQDVQLQQALNTLRAAQAQ